VEHRLLEEEAAHVDAAALGEKEDDGLKSAHLPIQLLRPRDVVVAAGYELIAESTFAGTVEDVKEVDILDWPLLLKTMVLSLLRLQ
jgi:hypothetical protein